MNYKEQLEAAIKDPSLITELSQSKGEAVIKEALQKSVNETVKNNHLDGYVAALLAETDTKTKPKNLDLFKQAQDASINHYGDITLESLNVAVASYLANGGEFDEVEVPDLPILFSELYGLDTEDELVSTEAKLTTSSRDKLPDGAFCGPNRSFPVHDRAHAVAAMRLLGRYKGGDKEAIRECISRKAKSLGVGTKKSETEDKLVFYPIVIETGTENLITPLSITNKDELQSTLDNVEAVSTSYRFTPEQTETFKSFLAEISENIDLIENSDPLLQYKESVAAPVSLNQEFLVSYFLLNEAEQRDYLTDLVGLVRSKKITKEDVEQSSSKYQVFGTSTLKVLLNKGFTENIQVDTVQTVPAPVEAVIETETNESLPVELFTKLSYPKGKRNPNSKEKN